jgi:outer membrane immunogenic protein
MKNALLAATALTALSFSAFAADLPARTYAPVAPAPIFSWTGFYVGANAGFIRSTAAATDLNDWWHYNETIHSSGSGLLGGVQAGYNYQVGAFVFGLEADLAASSADAKASTLNGDRIDQHKTSALGTVRGRIGYAFDRTLFYVTGGLAYANVKNRVFDKGQPVTSNAETSGWRAGYAVGGGIETAIDKNWTVKLEGLYYNVGHSSAQFVATRAQFVDDTRTTYAFKSKNDGALARIGVNYKF